MATAACDARIIKIATGGMKETMLWSNVTDPRTRRRLVAGMTPFYPGQEFWLRGAVLGEGGEYETLAIDGPRPLWKKKLVFNDSEVVTVIGEGGVYHNRLGGVTMMEKEPENGQHRAIVRIPELFDAQFAPVQTRIAASTDDCDLKITSTTASRAATRPSLFRLPKSAMNISPAGITLSNVVANDVGLDAVSQMSQIVRQVKLFLGSIDPPINTSNAVSALLLLSEMSDFATVNPVYASLFPLGEPNPPARVTVAVDLPPHVKVSLSLVVSQSLRSQLRGCTFKVAATGRQPTSAHTVKQSASRLLHTLTISMSLTRRSSRLFTLLVKFTGSTIHGCAHREVRTASDPELATSLAHWPRTERGMSGPGVSLFYPLRIMPLYMQRRRARFGSMATLQMRPVPAMDTRRKKRRIMTSGTHSIIALMRTVVQLKPSRAVSTFIHFPTGSPSMGWRQLVLTALRFWLLKWSPFLGMLLSNGGALVSPV